MIEGETGPVLGRFDEEFYEGLMEDGEFRRLFSGVYVGIYQKYMKFRKFYDTLLM